MEIRGILHRLAHSSGVSLRMARRAGGPRILMFHGVGTPACSTAVFRTVLEYLRTHFQVVPLAAIAPPVTNHYQSHSQEVALTFDDGLQNNFTDAYPILRELKLPATFFVCPGLIDTGKWLWNHESRQRLKSLGKPQRQNLASQLGAPHSDPNAIVEWMKELPHSRRQQAEATLIGYTPHYLPNPSERKQFDLMTWAEIALLDPSLITIGSHTTHHPILTHLEANDLHLEIDESRRHLENRLQRPIPHFCYPNGRYNATVIQRVRAVFEVAVTTEPRRLATSDDPYQLPRIAAADTLSDMTWRLHRPAS